MGLRFMSLVRRVSGLDVSKSLPLFCLGIGGLALKADAALLLVDAAVAEGWEVSGGDVYRRDPDGRPQFGSIGWFWPSSPVPVSPRSVMEEFIDRCLRYSGADWLESRYFDLILSGDLSRDRPVMSPALTLSNISCTPDGGLGMLVDVLAVSPALDTLYSGVTRSDQLLDFARVLAVPDDASAKAELEVLTPANQDVYSVLLGVEGTSWLGELFVTVRGVRRDRLVGGYPGETFFLVSESECQKFGQALLDAVASEDARPVSVVGRWKLPTDVPRQSS